MKKIVLVILLLSVVGCTGLMQTGSVSKAYEAYEEEDYTETLKLITQAENINEVTPQLRAELTYLRAQTYSKLGQNDKADALLIYLRDQRKDSPYGYLAAMLLEQR